MKKTNILIIVLIVVILIAGSVLALKIARTTQHNTTLTETESKDNFSEEDYQKKIDDLYVYFGEKPTYTTLSYNANNTYIYYWTDANNGFSVTCSRDFFGYYSPGYLEINWEAADDV